jgi:hypothetical protein
VFQDDGAAVDAHLRSSGSISAAWMSRGSNMVLDEDSDFFPPPSHPLLPDEVPEKNHDVKNECSAADMFHETDDDEDRPGGDVHHYADICHDKEYGGDLHCHANMCHDKEDEDNVLLASVVGLSMGGKGLLAPGSSCCSSLRSRRRPSSPSHACRVFSTCGGSGMHLRIENLCSEEVTDVNVCTTEPGCMMEDADEELLRVTCWNIYINPVFIKSYIDSLTVL